MKKHTTHEPSQPNNWPNGHVSCELTGDDTSECMIITIHGIEHYLHASTSRELEKMIHNQLETFNQKCREYGIEEV